MAVLRPDEEVTEKNKERANAFGQNIKTAALGAAGASIAPFLSEYLPTDLALKGISKVAPKVGQFLKSGMAAGLNIKDGLQFLKGKDRPQEDLGNAQQKSNSKENRSIIEQYDPELHIYIDQALRKGESLMEIGKKALSHGRFKKAIDKMTKDHKAPWSAILQTVYGNMGAPQQQAQPSQGAQQPQQQGQNPNWAAIVNSLKQVLGE